MTKSIIGCRESFDSLLLLQLLLICHLIGRAHSAPLKLSSNTFLSHTYIKRGVAEYTIEQYTSKYTSYAYSSHHT